MFDKYHNILGGMDPAQFLAEYWQKKPLLIRQAFPNFKTPIQPDELAGLACEDGVESRLVLEKAGERPWELQRGPFTPDEIQALPHSHWTLLVQDVDKLVPDVAKIREMFRFIPDWRMDDVMISYSSDQGSVGAHVDNYDVFLLQALGRKRWSVSSSPVENDECKEGLDLRILKTFDADEVWELAPGDMLYLPPRYAHWGLALGAGMTFSMGFRSPSFADMFASFADEWIAQWEEKHRFTDPDLRLQKHPAEITSDAVEKVVSWLRSLSAQPEEVRHWFGRLVTVPKTSRDEEDAEEEIADNWTPEAFFAFWEENQAELLRDPHARFAFMQSEDGVLFFVNGEEYLLPLEALNFVQVVTGTSILRWEDVRAFHPQWTGFLFELAREGTLYFDEDEAC